MLTLEPLWFGSDWRRRISQTRQAFPEFAEVLLQFRVFRIAKALASHDDNVPTHQLILVMPERLANHSLEAIPFHGKLHAFLSDHKTQARMIELVVACKDQEVFPRNLTGWGVEDRLELPGKQKPLGPTEVLTHLPVPKSDGQTLAAFGAATRQNGAAVLGGHASTETVGASALDGAGLESAFHG